jgi:arsenate reductase
MKPCSAKAQLYKYELKDKSLTEEDYKKYILEHYTFEPTCFVINNGVYVGGTQQNMLKVKHWHLEEMLHCLLQLFQ